MSVSLISATPKYPGWILDWTAGSCNEFKVLKYKTNIKLTIVYKYGIKKYVSCITYFSLNYFYKFLLGKHI